MFFKQLATKESSLSYFFGCGSLGKAMAVDVVAGDEEGFLDEAAKANVKINDVTEAGNVAIKVSHTPGHTLNSICLSVSRNASTPACISTTRTIS